MLVRAMIAETFGCPPSVIDNEEADDILRSWLALNKYRSMVPQQPTL